MNKLLLSLAIAFFVPATASTADCTGPDYSGRDLVGWDFGGRDLRCANFSGSNLTQATLERANLARANFEKAILAGANLNEVNAQDANFRGANLLGASAVGAILSQSTFVNAYMRGGDFTGSSLTGASMEAADVRFANFSGADFAGANLTRFDATFAVFRGADFSCARTIRADFKGADLGHVTGAGAGLKGIPDIAYDFWRGSVGWYAFDYREGPPIRQGRRPTGFVPSDGSTSGGYIWTDQNSWGVDVPDDSAVFPLLVSSFRTDVLGATVTARLRGRDLDLHDGAVNFSVMNPEGTRYRIPIDVGQINDGWVEITFTLDETKEWFPTYVRAGHQQTSVSDVLKNGSQIGILFHGFSAQPTGRLEMDSFSISLRPDVAAGIGFEDGVCVTPIRSIPRRQPVQ